MTTETLVLMADALRAFLEEQEHARQTAERMKALEEIGLSFSSEDLSSPS